MLNIKGTFLDNKVARRMFLLFMVSALLPILILAFFSIRQINVMTTQGIEDELRKESRNYGLLIYDRLGLLNEKLTVQSNNQPLIQSGIINRSIDGFSQAHIFNVNDSSYLTEKNIPQLSSSEKEFIHQGNPVLATQFQTGLPAKIYMYLAIENTNFIAVALIKHEALWGERNTFDDTKPFCIYAADNTVLFCSQAQLENQLQATKLSWEKATTGTLTLTGDIGNNSLVGFWSLFLAPKFLYPNFTIVITHDQNNAFSAVSSLKNIFITVSLLTLIIIAFLSTIQIRRYLTPLEEIMRGIQRISNNDFGHPITVQTDDEFNQLADSFNSMSTQLSHQFEFLTTMAEIDQHILSNITLKDILSTLIKQGSKAVQSESINIAMFTEDNNEVLDVYSEDIHHVHGVSVLSYNIKATDKDNLINKKTLVHHVDDDNVPSYISYLIKPPITSFVLVPVSINEKMSAILIFGFNINTFSQEILFRLRELGDRFTIALEKLAWEEQLYLQAHYDPLTQLPNRQLLNDRLLQTIKRSARDKSCFSLMFIDLDRFKTINDSLGHSSGDKLLKIVSQRLVDALRDYDTVSRLGGDEFIIFLSPLNDHDDLYPQSSSIANKILSSISEPYYIDKQEIHISASLGISSFPADGQDVETLIKNADSAMYHAKEGGRNTFKFYSKELNAKALELLTVETDLHHAIENEEFQMYYQPKVDTQSGKILGAEALIRWIHPDEGLKPPYQFIPIAEKTGLIKALGEWALRESCRQNKTWQEQGLPEIIVSVNLSPTQFQQHNLISIVEHALRDANLEAKYLDLEILEGSAIDDLDQTIATLQQFKDLGISISIDDYGTGYSTLSYIKNFPVDNLKIDRGFIQNIIADSGDQAIVSSTILLAHKLGLSVVAEGVEDKQQLALLQDLGCDEIQGYYFSRPIPADEFAKLLEKETITPP